MRLFKPIPILLLLATISSLMSGCVLMSDSDKESMTNQEKATLNLQMGARYMDMGMLDVAKEKLEAAVDLDSSNPETHDALAVFYERIRDYDRAQRSYEAALSRDKDNFSIKNNLGRFLCEKGEFDKGMNLLQESLDNPMNNRQWYALANIGLCHARQNNLQRAEDFFRQSLQLQPDYSPALQEMLKISYNNSQYMSARAFLERYKSTAKLTAETLWFGFQTERALGNGDAADEYKAQLLNAFPASKEALQVKTAINK